MKRRGPVCGRLLSLAAALALGAGVRPARGDGAGGAPPPAARSDVETAVERVLDAVRTGDADALFGLAASDEPDPWRVIDELMARGADDAATLFASAAPRKDVEALPPYVVARRGLADDAAARAALARANASLETKPEEALAAVRGATATPGTILSVRLASAEGAALVALGRAVEGARKYEGGAELALRLGWLAKAARLRGDAAESAFGAGDFALAHATWTKVLPLHRARGDLRREGRALANLGLSEALLGRLAAARGTYERAIAVLEKSGDTGTLAWALWKLGMLHRSLQDPRKARALVERAAGLIREEEDREDLAMVLADLADIHADLGDRAKGVETAKRALDVAEPLGDATLTTFVRGVVGIAYFRAEDYRTALEWFRRTLVELEAQKDEKGVANYLGNVANAHFRLGEPEKAVEPYERSLRMLEAQGLWEDAVRTLTNMGTAYRDLGDGVKSLECYRRAMRMHEEHGLLDTGGVTTDVARALVALGRPQAARPYFERVVKLKEEVYGAVHPVVATAIFDLADVLERLGQLEESRALLARGLAIREATLGAGDSATAWARMRLARALLLQNRFADAKPLLDDALATQERVHGPDSLPVARTQHVVAWSLMRQGERAAALPRFEKALRILERIPDPVEQAGVLNDLGVALNGEGRHAEARVHFELGLAVARQAPVPNPQTVLLFTLNLAWTSRLLHEDEAADRLYAETLDRGEAYLRPMLLGLANAERLQALRMAREFFDAWLSGATSSGDPAYGAVLRAKGLLTQLETAERRFVRRADPAGRTLARDLDAARRHVARLANAPRVLGEDPEARERRRVEFVGALANEERLRAALAKRFPALDRETSRRVPDVAAVQARLAPGDAVVDYLRAGDRYVAWVVPREGAVARVDLGEAEALEEDVRRLLELRTASEDPEDAAWKAAARRVRDHLLAPLAARLPADLQRLYVCPDASVASVPFAALPALAGERLLADDVTVVELLSAADLVPDPDRAAPGEGALLVGGVDYDAARGSEGSAAVADAATAALSGDRSPLRGSFDALPGSAREVKDIAEALGGTVDRLTGADATEARLREAARRKRVLHLATHGFVRDDIAWVARARREHLGALDEDRPVGYDPMVLSGLALAGANPRRGGGEDDGILTALEAATLDLDGCEMVVLSACDTARGRAESGEGVLGLVRGFRLAGARRVVASLWAVDDEATAALMTEFYARWRPKDPAAALEPAAALRAAQARVRADPRWRHPRYWAAWVLWDAPG